jgi:FkbM family methyltransferase
MAVLRSHAPAGGTVLDVGGNIGVHTLEAAQAVGPGGRVVAIEPMPHHAQRIRDDAALNGFRHVDVVQAAVGSAPGEVSIGLPAEGANEGMYCIGGQQDAVTVPMRTIDEIVQTQGLARVDVIKMDIEGAEFGALTGARQTLERFRPTILIEVNSPALEAMGSSSEEVMTLLGAMGYRGMRIGRNRLEPLSQLSECDECIFTPRS